MFVWLPAALVLVNPEAAEKDLFQRLHVNPVPSGELPVGVCLVFFFHFWWWRSNDYGF